jgi:transcriptional regulator with XRE-family HTH domain
MTDAERLGRQIEEARNARGWTQKDLAAKLGRGGAERTIQDWEAGNRTPRDKMLTKVRLVLGLEGDEDETRAQWPTRVRHVVGVLGDQLAELSPEDLRKWRHAFIVGVMQQPPHVQRHDWPDDVEVIVDIMGVYLVDGEQTP